MKNTLGLPVYDVGFRSLAHIADADEVLRRGPGQTLDQLYKVGTLPASEYPSADALAYEFNGFFGFPELGLTLEAEDLFYTPEFGGWIIISTQFVDREKIRA